MKVSVQVNKQRHINLVHSNNTMTKELKDFTDEDIFADDVLVKDFKKLSRASLTGDDSDQGGQGESIFEIPQEAESKGRKEKSIFDLDGGDSF